MFLATLLSTFALLLPVASSSAALSCSITQQYAYSAFFLIPPFSSSSSKTSTTTPPSSPLPFIYASWLQHFKKIVYFSASCHVTTMLYCLFHIVYSNESKWLWVAGLAFAIGHAYPWRMGLKFMGFKEDEWRAMTEREIQELLSGFVRVNKERLMYVDVVGCGFIVVAAVRGLAG